MRSSLQFICITNTNVVLSLSVISAPRTCSVQIRVGFAPYIQAFLPFLYPALKAHEDTQLCMVAVGISSHHSRQPGASLIPSTTPLIALNLWSSVRASATTLVSFFYSYFYYICTSLPGPTRLQEATWTRGCQAARTRLYEATLSI